MRKIYESPFNGWDERAEAIIVYELEEGEYDEIYEEYEDEHGVLDYERLLSDMGYYSEWGCVEPGALFTRFFVEEITTHHLIISQFSAYNV